MIKNGIDINIKNDDGDTALHNSAMNSIVDIFERFFGRRSQWIIQMIKFSFAKVTKKWPIY